MERTTRIEAPRRKVWPGMDQMISDYDSLERMLRDLRSVLAVIAWHQDDKVLSVSVQDIEAMPAGVELEVSFNPVAQQYNFKCVLPVSKAVSDSPAVAEGPSLTTDN